MLTVIIFIVALIRSFFPPEKVWKLLAKRNEFVGHIFASLLGTVSIVIVGYLFNAII